MKPRTALVVALAWCAGAAVAAPEVTIELRPQVQAAGSAVTLGDVAVLRSPDLGLMRALVDLPIGRAPASGQHALVHRTALAAWMRRRTGIGSEQVEWQGPEATRVGAAWQVVGSDTIVTAAAAALRERLAADGWRGELQVQSLPRDVEIAPGPLRLQARSLANAPLRERMLVWVEVWAGAQFIRAMPVSFHVDGARGLAGAAAPLEAAPPLPGAVPTVVRGQWASLRSGAGAVLSEARVEVLQDGRLGESVRVRQPGAAGAVIARVTGPGQLEVAR